MTRYRIAISLFLVFLLSPVYGVLAQAPPPGKWWRRPRIAQALKLSEGEKQRLDDLFIKSRRRLIRLKTKVEEERFELENLLEEDPLDRAAVMEQFRKLDKARSELAEERFRFLLGVRDIVGYERFERLKEMYRRYRRKAKKGW